jgi:hypothetical protein
VSTRHNHTDTVMGAGRRSARRRDTREAEGEAIEEGRREEGEGMEEGRAERERGWRDG